MLTVNFDDAIEARLRERAAANGRSPEDEAREVLGTALLPPFTENQHSEIGASGQNLIDEIQGLFAPLGGLDFEILPRGRSSRVKPTFVSEIMKVDVAPSVRAWISAIARDQLFTTAITSAEIFEGIARLPVGRRRSGLQASAEAVFRRSFAGCVLPFDEKASRAYASIAAMRRAVGRPIDELDGQIAAIARDARFSIVTRNVTDFELCGLTVIDPWTQRVP